MAIDWISFNDKTPEINQKIHVKFNRHRYGTLHSTDEKIGIYFGTGDLTDMPMVDFEYEDDECFMECTHWKPLVN